MVLPDDELAAPAPHIPPRRPVCGLAVAFCIGIALGLEYSVDARWLSAAGVFSTFAALLCWRRTSADILLTAGVICAGWVHATLCVHSPSAREVSAILVRPAEYVAVIGEVRDAPFWQQDERTGEIIWTFSVQLEGLHRVTAWQKASGAIEGRLRLMKSATPPQVGERWLFTGLLEPHARWRAGREEPAGYRITADTDGSRRLAPAGLSLYATCMRTRAICSDLLGRGLECFPEQVGLLRAVILNTREEMSEAMYRDFSVTGTMHIVAISGLHVAVIAILLLSVFRATGLTQPYWFFLLAPLLLFYTMMTGLVPSATRSCCMATIFWLAPFLQRRPDGLTSLAWSAILILAWDPTQFLDIGFLLSFSAVLGLILIYTPWAAKVNLWLRADPWQLQAEFKPRRWLRNSARYILLLALTAVVANIATGPLVARYFNLISPVALLSNLAVVPAAVLMITLGCLALLTGAVWTPLAEIFNSANLPVISFIMHCTEWSAELPGGHFFVRAPNWWWIATYYVALVLLLIGNRHVRHGVLTATALTIGLLTWQLTTSRDLAIHVWRLGGATMALVDAPRGDKLLINTGPRFVVRDLLRRIHAEGIGTLRALVLTRSTTDHAGGATDLLRLLPTRECWLPSGASLPAAQAGAHGQSITRNLLQAGQRTPLNGSVLWDVLYPPGGLRVRHAADRVPIFRVTQGSLSALFLNDAGSGAMTQLSAQAGKFRAPLVLAENAAILTPAGIEQLAACDIITPASVLRETQERYATLEQRGLRLWCMEEGDLMHIEWPKRAAQQNEFSISHGPSKTTAPITF